MNISDKKKFDSAAELLRTVGGKLRPRHTTAVIVAAGSSARMGGGTPKQFLPLCGMPVVAMTIRAYEEADCIDDIILVVRPGDDGTYANTVKNLVFTRYAPSCTEAKHVRCRS